MYRVSISIIVIGLFLTMPACKLKKQIHQTRIENKTITPPNTNFSLTDSINLHHFKYTTMSAKIRTEFRASDGSEISFMTTFRAVNDSAIWISLSPALGIEAARILLTRDSIKILDKLHQQYAIVPYTFLKQFTEADINFEILQNIFSGNAAFISASLKTDSITKYYFAHCSQSALFEVLTISKMFRILETVIMEKTTFDKVMVQYDNFNLVENEYLPYDIKIDAISRTKSASLLMNYINVSINVPVELKFNIPASYSKFMN